MQRDLDVLIIGAGLSGIGAACQLTEQRPDDSFAVLEAREDLGGTWDLFRYPGIRSDSDMFTMSYGFRPWDRTTILSPGGDIKAYIAETAEAYGVTEQIRYSHRVERLEWDSDDGLWTATVTVGGEGAAVSTTILTARFVICCTGYYRYDEGYTPEFAGMEDFEGQVVHPQRWPEDLDATDKRVVVIGSGATAMTIVPAMADQAAHITMLQRSPTYVFSIWQRDVTDGVLRTVLPEGAARQAIRTKNMLISQALYQVARRAPGLTRRTLLGRVDAQLPDEVDVSAFAPDYDPWDQRLCLIPGNDLFKALRSGKASVVTDTTEGFVAEGVRLGSGEVLEADIVVTATGLHMLMFGGMDVLVDGEKVVVADRLTYRGVMLDGVPNFGFVFGYINASWTLRADMVTGFLLRMLGHMDDRGFDRVVPVRPEGEETGPPLMDLTSGYISRALDRMPYQGRSRQWQLVPSYLRERIGFGVRDFSREDLRFSSGR